MLPTQPRHGVRVTTAQLSIAIALLGAMGGELRGQPGVNPLVFPSDPGHALFVREWQEHDDQSPNGDGLGPLFNARSCVDCHNRGGVGGSGSVDKNVELLCLVRPRQNTTIDRTKFVAAIGKVHPGFVANQTTVLPSITLHRFHTNPAYEKWKAALPTLVDYSPVGAVRQQIALQTAERRAPALFGAGLIDSIPPGAIERVARRQAARRGPIKGRAARGGDGGVGKFGWRGQTSTLEQFVTGACASELGLQVRSASQAVDPLHPLLISSGFDMNDLQCDQLVEFVASLPAPVARQPLNASQKKHWASGERLFRRAGCAECHLPKLGNVRGIYSDLLLHDMGLELADLAGANPPFDSGATASASGGYYGGSRDYLVAVPPETLRQWRTPPLWGIGRSGPCLHDGRAATLHDAIGQHGGEARAARDSYAALSLDAREKLLAFLRSAGVPPPAQTRSLTAVQRPGRL